MNRGRILLTLALLVALCTSDCLAHGGVFRGPGSGVGPGSRSGRTGGGQSGGLTGVSLERWEYWWAFNREEFLWTSGLRSAKPATTPSSSQGEDRLDTAALRTRLIPLLGQALKHLDTDMRDTAALVLGKTGDSRAIPLLQEATRDRAESVVEGAALGLGLLGLDEGIPMLVDILKSGRSKNRTRSYAALALGWIGGESPFDTLKSGVGFTKKRNSSIRIRNIEVDSARFLAFGLCGGDDSRKYLTRLLTTHSTDDPLKALVALALAKIGEKDAGPAVLPLLQSSDVNVRRSAAIALGRLAGPENKDIVKRLEYAFQKDADNSVKNFAAISLGRIGGEEAGTFLKKHFGRAPYQTRSFVAFALGISGDGGSGPLLRQAFQKEKDHSLRGAIALSLGILGDKESEEQLLKSLAEEKDNSLRGHLVLALGMMRAPHAATPIKRLLESERDVEIRGLSAEALGLLGDNEAVGLLLEMLEQNDGVYLTSSAALALGRLRTLESFNGLIDLAASERTNVKVRAFALAALGRIIDPTVPPTISRFVIDHNYRLKIPYAYDLQALL